MSSVRLTLARGRCCRCHFSWTSGERTLADSAARYRSGGHTIHTSGRWGEGDSRNSGHLGGPLALEGLCFLLSARGLIISLLFAHPRATVRACHCRLRLQPRRGNVTCLVLWPLSPLAPACCRFYCSVLTATAWTQHWQRLPVFIDNNIILYYFKIPTRRRRLGQWNKRCFS